MFKISRFISISILMFLSFTASLVSMKQQDSFSSCNIGVDIDCSICLESCKGGDDFVTPCCKQLFHFNCLKDWIKREPNCPFCRKDLSLIYLYKENEIQLKAREERGKIVKDLEEREQEYEEIERKRKELEYKKEIEHRKRELNIRTLKEIYDTQELLYQAILKDSADDIRDAINAGADVSLERDGCPPIFQALILKKSNAVKELIEQGSDINITFLNHGLVYNALKTNDYESAFLFIKNGADFSEKTDGKADLLCYALSRSGVIPLKLIQAFIDHGYDVCKNRCDWFESPLYWAITSLNSFDLPTIKLLLENGANPNQIIDEFKISSTPLLRAIYFGADSAGYLNRGIEVAKVLLDYGADINQKATPDRGTKGIQTPLSYAINLGHSSMAEFLLSHGASL